MQLSASEDLILRRRFQMLLNFRDVLWRRRLQMLLDSMPLTTEDDSTLSDGWVLTTEDDSTTEDGWAGPCLTEDGWVLTYRV